MKSEMVHLAFTAAALLALTDVATAQGTSGGNGAVASIPGSVVRGHEQTAGLISILSGSTPPNYSSVPAQRTVGIRGVPPLSGPPNDPLIVYGIAQRLGCANAASPPPSEGSIGANAPLPVGPPPN